MKYAKFNALALQYRWLEEFIRFALSGPIYFASDLKETVRRKIGFIAFRPFESLDMGATHSSKGTTIPDSRFKYVKMESWVSTYYIICFHIKGYDTEERLAFPDGKSIAQKIEELKSWYLGCVEFKDTTFVFNRIIKRTMTGSSYAGLTNANFEIYEFPIEVAGIHHPLRTPERVLNQTEIEARRAYMNHLPMPPIVPGEMLSQRV